MCKKENKGNSFWLLVIVLFSFLILSASGCKNRAVVNIIDKNSESKLPENTSDYPVSVKFRSFMTTDSLWGYTIFVNSRPYLHYTGVPFKNTGFATRKDADAVAIILSNMIKNGNMNPKLNKNMTDSLKRMMK